MLFQLDLNQVFWGVREPAISARKPNVFQKLILDMVSFLVVYSVRNVFLVAVCWGSICNRIAYNLWAINTMIWMTI